VFVYASHFPFQTEDDVDIIKRATNVLGRMATNGEVIRLIKEAGGVDIYLKVLDAFADDERIARLGGKFLSRVTGDSVDELVAILNESGASAAVLERTLALLAGLAMDGNSSGDIVAAGGCKAIINQLSNAVSPKALESTARAVARLARNAKNIQELVDSNVIQELVNSLTHKFATSESRAQAVEGLTRIAANPLYTNQLVAANSVPAVGKCLENDPSYHSLALACLKFFFTLKKSEEFDVNKVGDIPNILTSIISSMCNHSDDEEVQEYGSSILCGISESEQSVKTIVKNGGVPIFIRNIENFPENVDLLKVSMMLLSNMLLVKEGEVAIREGKGVDAVVSSVMCHPDNDEVRKAAMELVELLSSDELVKQMIDGLKKFIAGTMKESEYSKVPVMAMCLGTLAMIPENVTRIMKFGGVPPLVELMHMVSGMPSCPSQEEILSALSLAMREILGNVPTVEDIVEPATLLNASLSIPQNHPKKTKAVGNSMLLTKRILAMCPSLELTEFPVFESTVSGLRNNMTEHTCAEAGLGILLSATKVLGGNVLCKQNGTRVVVQIISVSSDEHDDKCLAALTSALLIIESVATTDEGRDALGKQSAVSAIFKAMATYAQEDELVQMCRRALVNLVTAEEVMSTLVELNQYDLSNPATLESEELINCVERLGCMLQCGDYHEVIEQNGGIQLLVNVMAAAQQMREGQKKNKLVTGCITAFGRAAGTGNVQGALPIVPVIVQALKDSPNREVLQAVQALTKDPAVRSELVNQGAVECLLPLIGNTDLDGEVIKFASLALAGLAADSEGARRIIEGGGIQYICDYIGEQEESAASVELLLDIAEAGNLSAMISGGVLDTVVDVLARMIGQEADPKSLTNLMVLLNKMAGVAEGAQSIMDKGIVGTVISAINGSEKYVKDEKCMGAFCTLVTSLATTSAVADAAEQLQQMGGASVLLAIMSEHSKDVVLVKSAAKALGLLKGAGADGLAALIEQMNHFLGQMESNDESAMSDFNKVLSLVGNLMLEEGALNQSISDQLMNSLQRAMNALRNFEDSSEKEEAITLILSTVSRLMSSGLKIDTETAVAMCNAQFGGSTLVVSSACACLGNIACVEGGIQSIAQGGLIATVQSAAAAKGQVGKIGATGMAQEAAKALEIISEQALSQAVSLIGTKGGADAIASILGNIEDPRALQATLDQICQREGGLNALLDAMEALGPPDFGGKALLIQAIVKSMIDQRSADVPSILSVNSASQIATLSAAYNVCPDSIILMESAGESAEGINWLANTDGCFDALVLSLASDNLMAAQMAASLFSKCIALNDPNILEKLKQAGVANALLMSLKDPQNLQDEIFAQNALYSLRTMADLIGVAEMGIGKEGIQIIQNSSYQHGAHDYIQDTTAALLAHLTQAFAGGAEALLEDRLRNLANVHAGAANWQQVVSEDGTAYFYNSATGESSWEQAAEHFQLENELASILDLVNSLDGNLKDLDVSCASSLVTCVGTHGRDAGVMGKIFDVLSTLCQDDKSASILAQNGNISDIIDSMQFHINDPTMMEQAMDIVNSMSAFDHLKGSLSTLEYITTINNTVWTHVKVKKLVMKGCKILHQLSADNELVIGYEMQVNVPSTIKQVMINHNEDSGVIKEAFICIGNLLGGDDDNKELCCQECCDEIVTAVERWLGDGDLFEIMLKTMGNMSLDDEAILIMVKKRATEKIVAGMKVHPEDEEILKLAIMVISNFGAINDEAKDAEATEYIINEGGTVAITDVVAKHSKSVPILEAAMEALFNLGNDVDAAIDLSKLGVMELTMSTISGFDYEAELLSWAIKFLSVFTYAEITLDKFSALNGTEVLLKVIQSRMDDEAFLQDATLTLSNALVHDGNKESLLRCDGVGVLLGSMDLYNHNPNLVKYVIAALNRLCTSDEVSHIVAEQGMHVFMKAVQANLDDTALLSLIFELFGQLAFVKENIKLIVQHGGIKIFLQMMGVYGDDEELMCQTLNTLDNVASADEEYAAILIEKRGEEQIKEVLAQHAGCERVQMAGDSTLLSMTAMSKMKEQEGSKVGRGALFARLGDVVDIEKGSKDKVKAMEECPDGDPLVEYRNLLRSGAVLTVYEAGSKHGKHIFVASDWQSIWVKDTSSKTKVAKRLYLSKLKNINPGYGIGHFKKNSQKTKADKDRSLFIDSLLENSKISCECPSVEERDEWVSALRLLLKTARQWPQKLNPDRAR